MPRWFVAATVIAALSILACSPRDSTDLTPATTATSPTTTATSPATATGSATAVPTATQGGGPGVDSGESEFDEDRAYAQLEALSVDIGERVSGTEGESAAAAYIADQFRGYGYEADVQSFDFDGERYGLSYVELPELQLTGFHLVGSIGGTVTSPTVYLGLGRQEDYAGKVVAGRIAIVDRGDISFHDKYERAMDTGAVGMIVINDAPRSLIFANLDTRTTFPVVGVTGEDREALLAAATAGIDVTVRVPDDEVGHAVNVVARVPGSDSCDILVGAHHDTVPASPGGNDNGSGVAEVLELARSLAADGLDEGLCFATFGAEEHGLYGSAELASTMNDEDRLPQIMVNIDVAGIGERVEVIGKQGLREEAIVIGEDLGIDVVSSSLPANAGSDHQSFEAHDVDVLFFTSGDFDAIHTPGDTIEPVEPAELARIGRVARQFIVQELERIARG